MKVWKTLLVVLVSGILLATVVGCGKKAATTGGTQIYTVKKGDISLTITAAGNLALSKTQDLPLTLFYPNGVKGTVSSVLVQLGDSVKEGQVLVTIDNDEWNDQLNTVQNNLNTAQRTVTTKSTAVTDAQRLLTTDQRAVTAAQTTVTKKQHLVDVAQLAVTQAEISVQSANSTLNSTAEVKKAKDAIDEARLLLKLATTGDSIYWSSQIPNIQRSITDAQAYYNDIVKGTGVTSSTDVALLIAQRALAVTQAQSALIDAQIAIDDAVVAVGTAQQAVDDANYTVTKQQQTLANAQADLDTANNALATAQKKLTDAQAMSPQIKAPFDGFVTSVNVKGGDEVLNGTVAVIVADPTKFQANILVSEMDIMKVRLGGDATMSLNALTGVTLPATVTQIAPTATISSGVVNYSVTVNITSVSSVTASSTPVATANATGRQPGGASGNFTTRAGPTSSSGTQLPSSSGRSSSQSTSGVTQNIQLKQGLTGTVNLIISQANNVLLVPSTAITKSGNQSTVNVMTANNTIEKRTIQTGLADWQNTEVTSGLNEGDKIVVTKGTSTTTSTSTQQRAPGGGIFLGR